MASIDDKVGSTKSITDINRVLDLFTDRIPERRLFCRYLNQQPPVEKILFFHGGGGNGKSWLMRMLHQRYCHNLSAASWEYLDSLEDGTAFVEQYENAVEKNPVPHAYLDFADNNRNEQTRNPFDGLMAIRKQLGQYGLHFFLFDYAMLRYQIIGLGTSLKDVKSLFPQEELSFADMLLDQIQESKAINWTLAAIKLLNKHFKKNFAIYLKQRKLNESDWHRLNQLEPKSELFDELPRLLAQDINAAMDNQQAYNRIVLLFDTHEAFWGLQRSQHSEDSFHLQDEWLRKLLRALDYSRGIVAAVTGREPPNWQSAPSQTKIADAFLDIQLIGHLSPPDADEYLLKAGIIDIALRQALVDYAGVTANQVHPLYLGLCGDIVLTAKTQGITLEPTLFADADEHEDKARELVSRLLKYCHADLVEAIKSLAAARSFNDALY